MEKMKKSNQYKDEEENWKDDLKSVIKGIPLVFKKEKGSIKFWILILLILVGIFFFIQIIAPNAIPLRGNK